ncbi:MAG: GAF domain-containing protein [Anaerolineae bacterium]|nr:GAF domain-containing protein [Anaerolineae bacterium]
MERLRDFEQPDILSRGLTWRIGVLGFIAIAGLVLGLAISVVDIPGRVRRQLDTDSRVMARYVDDFLHEIGDDLWATGDVVGMAGGPTEALLDRARSRHRTMVKLLLVNDLGQVVMESRRAGEMTSMGQSVMWLLGGDADRFEVGPVTFRADGEPIVEIAAPVRDADGQVTDYLAAVVELDGALADAVKDIDLAGLGYAYIVDNQGRLMSDRDDGVARGAEGNRFARRTSATLEAVSAAATIYVGLDGEIAVGRAAVLDVAEWRAVIEMPLAGLLTTVALHVFVLFVTFALLDVGLYAVVRFIRLQVAQPLAVFRGSVEALRQGDLSHRVTVKVKNELGILAGAFNTMAINLQDLVANLERRVAERTRDLAAISELGRLLTAQRDMSVLLPYAVQVIQRHTDFYHVQIFLIDDDGEYAVLRASTGEAGRLLLEAGHRLAVGSESVIGRVAETGQSVIALDTEDAMVVHRPNPLLPDTRSEMALPLRVGSRLMGALDVQSLAPNAFTQRDVELFQTLADQLASAIDNAQQAQALSEQLRAARQLNRVLMGEAYAEAVSLRRTDTIGYTAYGADVREDRTWTETLRQAALGEMVVKESAEGRFLSLPIVTRGGAPVGAFEFELDPDEWREDLPDLAGALLERVTVSLETARVFEQAQRLAAREQQVNQVTARLQEKTEIEDLLEVAADEIRRALQARRAAIRVDLHGDAEFSQ